VQISHASIENFAHVIIYSTCTCESSRISVENRLAILRKCCAIATLQRSPTENGWYQVVCEAPKRPYAFGKGAEKDGRSVGEQMSNPPSACIVATLPWRRWVCWIARFGFLQITLRLSLSTYRFQSTIQTP